MRWIVATLFIANLVFLAWGFWEDRRVAPLASVPQLQEPAAPVSLRLRSERPAYGVEPLAESLATRQCLQVGEFDNFEDALYFRDQLQSAGVESQVLVRGNVLASHFRVYLPPFSSREIATLTLDNLQQVRETQNLAFESYLITRGPLENAIALGIFENEAEAAALRDTLNGLSITAMSGTVPRSEGPVFIQLSAIENSRISTSFWQELVLDRPAIARSEIVCETIAQANQFP